MTLINEGMRPGDLEDLVLPMITVDEYESKIDDSAVVIGFFVHDKDAADDLNRFIQKSAVPLLDTEVSPAPDQHGYYLVFVEFMNDAKIASNINSVLEEVTALTTNDVWQMCLRGVDDVVNFSQKKVAKHFETMRHSAISDNVNEHRIMKFLTPSDLTSAEMDGSAISLKGSNCKLIAEVVALGNESLYEARLPSLTMDIADAAWDIRVSRLLGEGWVSNKFGDLVTLRRPTSDLVLVLKNPRFA